MISSICLKLAELVLSFEQIEEIITRQSSIDDLLDLFEAQHKFSQLLRFQIVTQRVVVGHYGLLVTGSLVVRF